MAPTNHHSTPTLEEGLDEEVDLKIHSGSPIFPVPKRKIQERKLPIQNVGEKAITDHPSK